MSDQLKTFTARLRQRLGDRALLVARAELERASDDVAEVWQEIVEALERSKAVNR